ncbi:uncharacterized protein [Antedon mediterranea]|uniref:uncharacterized protein n=1 Tax=Antedon mediterranea TaxID=105859 RepID=UPI003AF7F64E
MEFKHKRIPGRTVSRELFKNHETSARNQRSRRKHQQENVGVPLELASRQSLNSRQNVLSSSALKTSALKTSALKTSALKTSALKSSDVDNLSAIAIQSPNSYRSHCAHYDWMKQENAPALSRSMPMTLKDLHEGNDDWRNPEETQRTFSNSSRSMTLKDLEDEDYVRRTSYHHSRPLTLERNLHHQEMRNSYHYSSSIPVNTSSQTSHSSWNEQPDLFLPDYSQRLSNLLVDDIDAKAIQRQSPSPRTKLKNLLYMSDDCGMTSSTVKSTSLSPPAGYGQRKTSPRRTASLLWVFKLLDILHCVPPEQHQQLITKAYWLRRWQAYVRKVKGERLLLIEQQQRAIDCHNKNLKLRVLKSWMLVIIHKKSKADRLHEYHLKAKGLKSLSYCVKRSQLDEEQAVDFYLSGTLKSYFAKWQERYYSKRQHQLKVFFQKWKKAKLDKERLRIIQHFSFKQTLSKFFERWKEQCETNNKERIASLYYKVLLLSRYFTLWRTAVENNRKAYQDVRKATTFHNSMITRRMIQDWKIQTAKATLSKMHYRNHLLYKVFSGLKRAVQVSRVERLEDNSKAMEFKRLWRCRHCLATWKRTLSQKKFQKQKERKQIRRAFQIWCLKLQRNHIQTRLVSALANKNLLKRYFTVWCTKVKEAEQRQIGAIYLLRNLRMKIVFQKWLQITKRNIQLREKLEGFQSSKQTCCKHRILIGWKSLHLEHQKWSLKCARNAWNNWVSLVKQRKMEQIFNQSQNRVENRLLTVFFNSWLAAKRRIDLNAERALSSKKCLQRSLLHQMLLDWQLKTRKSKVIAPMRLRQDKKLLCRVFTAWSTWSATSSDRKQKLIVFQQRKLSKIFINWRSQVNLLVKETEAKEKLLKLRIRQVICSWRAVVSRRKKQVEFVDSTQKRKMNQLYFTWKDTCERLEMKRQTNRGNDARKYIMKMMTLRNWKRAIQQQLHQETESCQRIQQLQECNRRNAALSVWRRQLKCQKLARAKCDEFQIRHLHGVFITWHQLTQNVLQDSFSRFSMAVLSQCLIEDSVDGTERSSSDLAYQSSPDGYWSRLPLDESKSYFEDQLSQVDVIDGPNHRYQMTRLQSLQESVNSPALRMRSQSWSSGQQTWMSEVTSDLRCHNDDQVIADFRSKTNRMFPEQASGLFVCNERGDGNHLRDTWWCLDDSRGRSSSLIPSSGTISSRENSVPGLPSESYTVIRLQKIIRHWKHWPMSIAFKQWWTYTKDMKMLRESQQQLQLRQKQLHQRAVFPYWLQQTHLMRQAREHYNVVLMSNCLHKLLNYKQQRQKKHEDTVTANNFSQRTQLGNSFDTWRIKSLENQKIIGVMDTWKEYMGWSEDAERKVQVMREELKLVTIKECWYIWKIKHKQLQMVDEYRNNVLKRRCLLEWFNQSSFQAISNKNMQQFRTKYLLKKAFGKWKFQLRIHYMMVDNIQLRQTVLLGQIVNSWHEYTMKRSKLRTLASNGQQTFDHRNKRIFFQLWKHQAQKMQEATHISNLTSLRRCLTSWHQEVKKRAEQAASLQHLRTKTTSVHLRRNFLVWKRGTECQRLLKNILKMKEECQKKEVMKTWKEFMKLRKAEKHHRHQILLKTIRLWRESFLVEQQTKQRLRHVVNHWRSRVEKSKQLEQSVVMLETTRIKSIQQRGFVIWKEETKKQKMAVSHSRHMTMKRIVKSWLNYAKQNHDIKQKIAEFKDRRLQENMWRLWKEKLNERHRLREAIKTLEKKKLGRVIHAWHLQIKKQKELVNTCKKVNQALSNKKMQYVFKKWKESLDVVLVMKRQAESSALVRLMLLRQRAFYKWKQVTLTRRAVKHREDCLMRAVFCAWKKQFKEDREQKQFDQDLQELADWHYQRRLRRVIIREWYYEVKVEKFRRKQKQNVMKQTFNTWTTRTSQSLMATQIVEYKLYSRFWKQWRTAFVTNHVLKNMDVKKNSHISSQVFNSWQRLSSLHSYGNQLRQQNSQEVLKTSFSKWREVFNSLSSSSNCSSTPPTDNNSSCSSELAAIWEFQ